MTSCIEIFRWIIKLLGSQTSSAPPTSVDTNNFVLEERFTLFFDLLGVSSAAKQWSAERKQHLVKLLIWIAHVQSVEVIGGKSEADGSYSLTVTPEVTTFSDNIVVSYPSMPDDPKVPQSVWAEIVCKDAMRILSWVAEMALRIGVLIRGGLSYGELHHTKGVVFGEGLVDAYALESKKADNPRVVVSDHVIAKLTHDRPEDMKDVFLRDIDGMWHLNYFTEMVRRCPDEGVEQVALWKDAHLKTIARAVDELHHSVEAALAKRRAAKWEWFKERFQLAASRAT
jgi:hypothetical protein